MALRIQPNQYNLIVRGHQYPMLIIYHLLIEIQLDNTGRYTERNYHLATSLRAHLKVFLKPKSKPICCEPYQINLNIITNMMKKSSPISIQTKDWLILNLIIPSNKKTLLIKWFMEKLEEMI